MILHIDMDAFYTSVEEREHPSLKGKPLVVGGQPCQRGVVASANYAARKYGVFSAMSTAIALKKCSELQVIKPNFNLYHAVSRDIFHIFSRYTPIIESISLDEAFLDTRGSEKLHGDAVYIGQRIKTAIKGELDLTASVGIAPSKFVAKLASDYQKPDGFTVVKPDQVINFIEPLTVSKIWGVGPAVNKKLADRGIYKVSDIRRYNEKYFKEFMGKQGLHLWKLAHGIDNREVTTNRAVKSISQETTFSEDVNDIDLIDATAMKLVESVCFRLRNEKLTTKTITVKIRYADFSTITRRKSLQVPTQITTDIWFVARNLLKQHLAPAVLSIRLIGVEVSNFHSQEKVQNNLSQTDLFGNAVSTNDRNKRKPTEKIDQLVDSIKQRFGNNSIKRARSSS